MAQVFKVFTATNDDVRSGEDFEKVMTDVVGQANQWIADKNNSLRRIVKYQVLQTVTPMPDGKVHVYASMTAEICIA